MIPMMDGAVPGMTAMHLVVDPAAIVVLVGMVGAVALMMAGVARELRDRARTVRLGRLAPVAA
jgi:hypothetical protein